MNTDISKYPVHPYSSKWVASVGRTTRLHPDFGTFWNGAPIGIPYTRVTDQTPAVPVTFRYASESDKGPYPIPTNAPIEGGAASTGDRHVIVINTSTCTLYEMWDARRVNSGARGRRARERSSTSPPTDCGRRAGRLQMRQGYRSSRGWCGTTRSRPAPSSTPCALRSRARKGIHRACAPLRELVDEHQPASDGRAVPAQGVVYCSTYSREVRVICAALKKYGMIVADNGSNWYVSGAHDPRWNDARLGDLKKIPGSAFEVVYTGKMSR